MARLSANARNNLPDSAFALPEKRKFPIHDRPHAVQALRTAHRALNAGSITKSEYQTVMRKARAKLSR